MFLYLGVFEDTFTTSGCLVASTVVGVSLYRSACRNIVKERKHDARVLHRWASTIAKKRYRDPVRSGLVKWRIVPVTITPIAAAKA